MYVLKGDNWGVSNVSKERKPLYEYRGENSVQLVRVLITAQLHYKSGES